MSRIDRPPETYQQWLTCLEYIRDNPSDREILNLIRQGSLTACPSEQFLARISDTVSLMLTRCCRRFLRQTDEFVSLGELDSVPVLAVRYQKHARQCLFYRDLTFLSEQDLKTLDEGFTGQLSAFWSDFLKQVRLSARDSNDPRMEDMSYELGHIRILTERRQIAGQ